MTTASSNENTYEFSSGTEIWADFFRNYEIAYYSGRLFL
jgi:hypothetical protein